jgi:translocator protein
LAWRVSERRAPAPERGARWKPVVAAAAAALAVAMLGALSTDIGSWYQSLKEPAWKPPDFLFGPAWTTIYACAAVAGVIAWRRAATRARREWMLGLFAVNAFANVLWSLLFFRLRRPDLALMEVGFLWLTILVLIVYLGRFARPSGWLLVPYLGWVSFAATLNYAVVQLNAPFVGL